MKDFETKHAIAILLALVLGLLIPITVMTFRSEKESKPRRGTGAITTPIGDEQ